MDLWAFQAPVFIGIIYYAQTFKNNKYFRTGGINIPSENLKRDICIKVRLSESERDLVAEKMAAANIRNREAYIRKMILDGYVVRLDFSDVRKMVQLLSNATANINQIAKRANETRNIYESDIKDLQAHYTRLWEQADAILRGLAKIKR